MTLVWTRRGQEEWTQNDDGHKELKKIKVFLLKYNKNKRVDESAKRTTEEGQGEHKENNLGGDHQTEAWKNKKKTRTDWMYRTEQIRTWRHLSWLQTGRRWDMSGAALRSITSWEWTQRHQINLNTKSYKWTEQKQPDRLSCKLHRRMFPHLFSHSYIHLFVYLL